MDRPDNASIKRSLSRRFPATSWSVVRGRGTAYSWARISWTDGPSTQLVESFLGTIGAAPGSMDNTDYFSGNRINTSRHISDAFRARVVAELLAPKVVPPEEAWSYTVKRSNCGGYYDLNDCIHRAISHRESPYFEGERFAAHAWLEAWAHGRKDAPNAVCYEVA